MRAREVAGELGVLRHAHRHHPGLRQLAGAVARPLEDRHQRHAPAGQPVGLAQRLQALIETLFLPASRGALSFPARHPAFQIGDQPRPLQQPQRLAQLALPNRQRRFEAPPLRSFPFQPQVALSRAVRFAEDHQRRARDDGRGRFRRDPASRNTLQLHFQLRCHGPADRGEQVHPLPRGQETARATGLPGQQGQETVLDGAADAEAVDADPGGAPLREHPQRVRRRADFLDPLGHRDPQVKAHFMA